MARGYPDYFGTSIWPKYGTLLDLRGSHVSLGAGTHDHVDILGPGVLYSGAMGFVMPIGVFDPVVTLRVDGIPEGTYTIADYAKYGPLSGQGGLLELQYYSALDYSAVLLLGREVPFGQSLKITVTTDGVWDALTVTWHFGYYRVT